MKNRLTKNRFNISSIIGIALITFFVLTASNNSFAIDLEVTGTITELGSGYLVVQGLTLYVDGNTEVLDRQNDPISFESLAVGNMVQVKYSDNTNLALRIKLEDSPGNENEIEITGYVSDVGTNTFTISGYIFTVDEYTEFRGRHGNTFSFEEITAGMLLEVKANVNNGINLAIRVKTEDDHNHGHEQEIELTGRIQGLTANSISINGMEFFVNEQTIILGNHNTSILFSALNLNDRVEVKAFKQPDNSFLAVRIKLEDNNDNEIELTAKIESINLNVITVQGIMFITDANTIFLNHNRQPITIEALSAGMLVEIKGFKNPDETYYATRVKAEDFFRNEIEIKGNISEITTTYLVVNGITFSADNSTLVFDHLNNPIAYSSLQNGQLVEVKGEKTGISTGRALRIKMENNEDIEMFGRITSKNTDNIVLNGLIIYVNENTVYLNHANQSIAFNDINVDQFLEVKMIRNADSTLLALRIKIEDGMNFSKINGTVGTISGSSVQIGGNSFTIDNQTIMIDINYNIIGSNQLTNGQAVTIWALTDPLSNKTALQIQSKLSSTTGVGENPTVADEFNLAQNYPNPFNPSTTISFTLSSNQFVTLKVYNAIGEEVATLVNGELTQGIHNINFNATELSSGFYIYRLESSNTAQVKKMILLK